jgi:hypothetical protein
MNHILKTFSPFHCKDQLFRFTVTRCYTYRIIFGIANKTYLSTAAWISRYYHTHLQSFELRNVVHYRTGFIT